VLRLLAVSPEPELLDRLTDEGIRLVLKLAADGCEHLDEAEQERQWIAAHAAELRSLLDRVAVILDAQPSPSGGWKLGDVHAG
jgi:hypothetical protein